MEVRYIESTSKTALVVEEGSSKENSTVERSQKSGSRLTDSSIYNESIQQQNFGSPCDDKAPEAISVGGEAHLHDQPGPSRNPMTPERPRLSSPALSLVIISSRVERRNVSAKRQKTSGLGIAEAVCRRRLQYVLTPQKISKQPIAWKRLRNPRQGLGDKVSTSKRASSRNWRPLPIFQPFQKPQSVTESTIEVFKLMREELPDRTSKDISPDDQYDKGLIYAYSFESQNHSECIKIGRTKERIGERGRSH